MHDKILFSMLIQWKFRFKCYGKLCLKVTSSTYIVGENLPGRICTLSLVLNWTSMQAPFGPSMYSWVTWRNVHPNLGH